MSIANPPPALSSVLADLSRAGVRPLPPGGSPRLAEAAAHNGFACVSIDLGDCEDKAGLLARIARALDFPDWFGHNWDALADSITDLSWKPAAGYVLLIEQAGPFRAHHTEDFETALSILREASASWAAEGKAFWSFVDLSGPA